MRTWSLKAGDPGAFIIAADARCVAADYTNDQIWDLNISSSEPPALVLKTSFGLRARSLRLFPRFVEGDFAVTDPGSFSSPPLIRQFFPNYLLVSFSPMMGIDVELEYWVPTSQSVAGRIHITNTRLSNRKIRLEWAALLRPGEGGHRMGVSEHNGTTVLTGQTDGLAPVVFMTGGPEASSGPYPALSHELDLAAGGSRHFSWVHAGLEDVPASFDLAKEIIARNWDSAFARIEVLNGQMVDIETGNPDWDTAFALAQKVAFSLYTSPSEHLPEKSFLINRQPDQGFSPRGDGNDYTHLWGGQSVLEAHYLSQLVLPGDPEFSKGLLRNYLSIQTQKGYIDWKPGLAGQRGRMLATPFLVDMAWNIFLATEDLDFIAEVFPGLVAFIQAWFSAEQDRDGDGIPEWTHPLHSGYEDHPTFSQWTPDAQGVNISTTESISLCALLYRELNTLIKLARMLERTEPLSALEALADNLKSAVEASWDPQQAIYHHWDRETHLSPQGEYLGELLGAGEILLHKEFDNPNRLLIAIQANDERARPVTVNIHGLSAKGRHRVETISDTGFHWYLGRGTMTSSQVYQSIEYIQITGIEPQDHVSVQTVNLAVQDHTLLTPLWAKIPDQSRANILVKKTIMDQTRFWGAYGIPACYHPASHTQMEPCFNVHLPWNSLICEGLFSYGHESEAVALFGKFMEAVVLNLKKHWRFFQFYHAKTGDGRGEANAITGLPPLGLFLRLLGVRIISPKKIALSGYNPFPHPVTIRFRGLTIIREKRQSKIIFPGGQTAIVRNPKPRIVTIET